MSHRIRNGVQLGLMLAVLSIFFIFWESFSKAFVQMSKETPPIINIMFLISVALAVAICLFMFTKDLIKSKQKIIDEQKQLLNNRISLHEKAISDLKNEIQKLDSNG